MTLASTRTTAGLLASAAITTALIGVAAPAQAAGGPHYTWGIITGTVYFNRGETHYIAQGAASAAELANHVDGRFAPYLRASSTLISRYASSVDAKGSCFKLKSDGVLGSYSGSSGDGYCR